MVTHDGGRSWQQLPPPPKYLQYYKFDGLCAGYVGTPAGCPYGSTGYEGRANALPVASTAATTFPAESYTGIAADLNSGTVNFLNPAIPPGGSAYFSLEGPTSSIAPCSGGTPTTVALSPLTATNPVSTSHTVTATVDDNCGAPVGGVTVQFTVVRTPPPGTSASCVTNASGQCSFTYLGPILPATDTITGCAGAGGAPPCGTATKTWVLPASSPLCTIDITQGGWMIANNGDKVTSGGTVHTDQANAPSGQEQYTDKKATLDVHSINILAITCSANLELADIYGTATENGSGSHNFRIEVTDPDSSNGADTYWIVLDNYNSGSHTLGGGHVEIHRT